MRLIKHLQVAFLSSLEVLAMIFNAVKALQHGVAGAGVGFRDPMKSMHTKKIAVTAEQSTAADTNGPRHSRIIISIAVTFSGLALFLPIS